MSNGFATRFTLRANWKLKGSQARWGPFVEKRLEFPIPLGRVEAYMSPDSLRESIREMDHPQVRFWATRSDRLNQPDVKNTKSYTLVSVGNSEEFKGLSLVKPPADFPPIVTPDVATDGISIAQLSRKFVNGATLRSLTFALEGPDGIGFPFEVTTVSHVDDAQQARELFDQVFLVLIQMPGDPGPYKLLFVWSIPGSFGGGDIRDQICANLTGTDVATKVARAALGCP